MTVAILTTAPYLFVRSSIKTHRKRWADCSEASCAASFLMLHVWATLEMDSGSRWNFASLPARRCQKVHEGKE